MLALVLILLCFCSFRVALVLAILDTPSTLQAKLTPTSTQPQVLFAAHSTALLFINGQLKSRTKGWDHVGSAQHPLKYGDVISIYASGAPSSNQGLIAAVCLGNPTDLGVVHTGVENWKAIALSRHTWNYARHWTGKDGSSCLWPPPKTTLTRRNYQRQLLSLPVPAHVVWAHAAKSGTPVLFRYVVGGEKCNKKSTISLASKDIALLYIDGKFRGSVSRWNQFKTIHAKLAKGSVIALKVRGKKRQRGILVDISLNAEHHVVTGQRGWTAIRGHMKEAKNPHGWRSGQFSSCHWPPAVPLLNHQSQMNLKLHDREGARYVWTDGKGKKGVMLLRYVVGGERCESQTKILVRSRPSSWVYINGRLVTHVKAGGQETISRQLSKGDVIGVLSKGRRKMGVQIAMKGPQGAQYSGGLGWKGLMGRSPQGWKMKSYSSCGWRSAVVLKEKENRHATRSKTIWASKGRPGISLLRFVVGGEHCATIEFESPGSVRLYVNGRPQRASSIGRFTSSARVSLKIGDIVGIAGYPRRTGNKNWVRAVVRINDRFYPTGSSDWRVTELPVDSAWTSRRYKACKWLAGNIVGGLKRLRSSPVPARAVWANDGAVALRFAVGGGGCEPEQVPETPGESARKAELKLCSDNEASLFVNGKLVLQTDSWRSVGNAVLHVKDGDVFVVHARDGGLWFGLRVSLLVDGNEIGTGVGDWRMRGTRSMDMAWTSPGFSGCHWPKPTSVDGGRLFETEEPKIHGRSHHVWAKDTNHGNDVVARFVVGGLC